MADSDSEWWEELLVVEPAACSAPAPAPGPLLPDPVPVVESLLSVQSALSCLISLVTNVLSSLRSPVLSCSTSLVLFCPRQFNLSCP